MQQLNPQIEPPINSNSMRDIIPVLATLVGAIIGAIILGTTHVIGFDWIVAILVGIMFGIMLYCIWYTFRTRQKLQEQYNKELAALQEDNQRFKQNWQIYFDNEKFRWDEWAVSFSQAVDKEHKERTEELKRQCIEAIRIAEQQLDITVKNAQSLFKGAVESYDFAVNSYKEQLFQVQKQIQALEERLPNEARADNIDQSSESKISPA